jgi:hypothetical protein
MASSLPAMSVAEPFVGAALGIAVLGEALRTNDVGWLVLALAVAVMVVAIVALARGEAVAGKPLEPANG